MTYYYFMDDMDASMVVMHMLQACYKYFVVDGRRLMEKLNNLDKLRSMWNDGMGDTYETKVYKNVCGNYEIQIRTRSNILNLWNYQNPKRVALVLQYSISSSNSFNS